MKNLRTTYLIRFVAASVLATLLLGGVSMVVAQEKPTPVKPADDRAVLYYFHRTVRCPSCQAIGSLTEETAATRLKAEVAEGRVTLHMIDFQDEKNAKYVSYYKIEKPTLVVLDVRDNRVKRWKTLNNVWLLFSERDKFLDYVETQTRSYLEAN